MSVGMFKRVFNGVTLAFLFYYLLIGYGVMQNENFNPCLSQDSVW